MKIKKSPLRFIIFLGVVSLFADITYEGARSITGPFLSILGASGAVVGIVIGFGEFVGYGLRVVSGYLTDKTKQYWAFTFIGYILNLTAVPLLAFTEHWQAAAFLIILERFGKAVRAPPRDALLSYATKHTGRGLGFGIHEALDQIGAILGPLLIALILFLKGSFQLGFAFLAIPGVFAIIALIFTRISYPRPQKMEEQKFSLETKGLSKKYWIYVFGVGFVAAGYVDFALIAYHFQKAATLSPIWITLFYSIAMGVDGIAALIMGKLFDVKGIVILTIVTAIVTLFAPLVFWGSFYVILIGIILWGIGMGSQESIMRAIVAALSPIEKRGAAYGILNLIFGLFWAVGSAIIGIFYDISLIYVVAFSMIAQLASIPFFLAVRKH